MGGSTGGNGGDERPPPTRDRALIIRGNITPREVMEIVKLVRQLHDKRPGARLEITIEDANATMEGAVEAMRAALPLFYFRCLPYQV